MTMPRRNSPAPRRFAPVRALLSAQTLAAVLASCAVAAVAAQPSPALARVRQVRRAQAPLAFEVNQGQTSAQAAMLARTQGSVVFLTARGAMIKTASRAVGITFAGATA